MKHISSHTIIGFLAIISTLCMISCSDSDNINTNVSNNPENQQMVGTKWIATNWDYGIGDDWVSTMDETVCFYFYSSTEGLIYYGEKLFDSDFGSSNNRYVAFFTFNVNGNQIKLDYITEPLLSNFTALTLNYNTLSANGYKFSKENINTNDSNWLTSLHGTTGACQWYYNLRNTIWIIGNGKMADYASYDETPWGIHKRTPNIVVVEDGVTSIGAYAFSNPSIGKTELPTSLNTIGKAAFAGTSIPSITLYDNLKAIESEAFSDCSYLNKVSLPQNLEEIGDFAFSNCKSVSLSKTNKLKRIGNHAFMGCNVTSWTSSKMLEEIGNGAFSDCDFSKIELPNSLKKLGNLAFTDAGIKNIHIGTGLKNITGTAFYPSSQGSMYVDQNTPMSLSADIIDSDKIGNWTLYVPKGSKNAYLKANYWKNFKSINESSQLTGDGSDPGKDEIPESAADENEQDEIDAKDSRRGSVSTQFKGNGTSTSPYLISSAADLRLLSDECRNGNTFKNKYFKMTNDIAINKNVLNYQGEPNNDNNFERWIPIGRSPHKANGFYGSFDGNGYSISGIYINRQCGGYVGLFGQCVGEVKNLTIKDSYIYSTTNFSGSVIGHLITEPTKKIEISNCHNYATIRGNTCGGVIGYIGGSGNIQISKCSNLGYVYGTTSVSGGIIGTCSSTKSTTISDCVNAGNVSGFNTGGIVGSLINTQIVNCINVGKITAELYAAGIGARIIGKATMTNCVNLGEITGKERSSALSYYAKSATITWNYYLNSMSSSAVDVYESSTIRNNNACSSMEMKSEQILDDLNSRKGSNSPWIKGSDGYPMLNWFAE